MKLRNSRFRYQNKGYLESISWEQLRNCLFRFLKEFGFYGRYIKEIKPYMTKQVVETYEHGWDAQTLIEIVPISYKAFVRKNYLALTRQIFPPGVFWDEIYYLWMEWSFEEDNIYSKTYIQ